MSHDPTSPDPKETGMPGEHPAEKPVPDRSDERPVAPRKTEDPVRRSKNEVIPDASNEPLPERPEERPVVPNDPSR